MLLNIAKVHVNDDGASSSSNRNTVYNSRPACNDDACMFNLPFSVMQQTADSIYDTIMDVISVIHTINNISHLALNMCQLRHLPPDIDKFIIHHLNDHVPSSTITKLVLQTYDWIISQKVIYQYRDNLEYLILKEASDLPYDTPVDRLIAEFSKKSDICFVYFTHNINSEFVTYQKK